jgi:hypothetical protein
MRMKDWETGAHEALLKAGAITPCPHHSDIYLRTHDTNAESHAYAIATNMLKFGEVRKGPRSEYFELSTIEIPSPGWRL